MIYIDPPYNTGHDFIYKDDYSQSAADYVDNSGQTDEMGNRLVQNTENNGRFHTDWLNMIYPRLKLAKNLLAEDGLIFASIDDKEVDNLKKILDEIFGYHNFINIFVWQKNSSEKTDKSQFTVNTEYILLYANTTKYELENAYKPLSTASLKLYKFDDNDGRGKYQTVSLQKPKSPGPETTYDYIDNNGKIWPCPPKGWRMKKEKIKALENDNRLVLTGNTLRKKDYWNERKNAGKRIDTLWNDLPQNSSASEALASLFNGTNIFDNPKPIELIQRCLDISGDNGIILDFFSGSSSTAHAVMDMNAKKNKSMLYIMVQLPVNLDEALKKADSQNKETIKTAIKFCDSIGTDHTICDIGEERIRRAGKKIKEETGVDIDYGFRCFKVDSSNMKDVYYKPSELEQKTMSFFADNIKDDRTPEDLLVQVMLDLGVLLSSKVERTEIAGKKVFSVADGYLMACFDQDVTEEVVTAIAKKHPFYVVFRDSSMADDSVSANFEQIFETYSPQTIRKVI